MAQPLQSINLVAPAFKGINTEDSPLAQDPSYAEIADNAIIDKRGRIASRKGIELLTENKTVLGTDRIHKVHVFYDNLGNEVTFSTGNNKILTGTTTLVDATPSGYNITANNWKIVNFNNSCYFFQRDYEPLVYNAALGAVTPMGNVTNSSVTTAQYCHEALAGFGRLWVVGTGTNKNTIYWSDLLDGIDFSGGSSGSIDVSKAWPDGFDEVRAISAHNNLLIIFGNHSIIVYQNADSPANMSLADTVAGVGCICRNSIQSIGTDVLFMSHSGLRSFGRTIQEKSMPISDLSRNVKQDLIELIQSRTSPTASSYSPENYFYVITFPNEQITYCFDLRGVLENGAYRATRWPSSLFKAWHRKTDGTLLTGTANGIGTYSNYLDENGTYRFSYYSPGLTFGDPSKLKLLKKLRPTLVGANNASVVVNWAYDFEASVSSQEYTVGSSIPAYYNTTSEYTLCEFTGGVLTSRKVVNCTGDGTVITIGLEAVINGSSLSLQEINVLAMIGKTI
tara:strand:+ start:1396 stop:2919 length:1524 start_codon:yes stop_codon:yes gene_type:complete